MSIDTDVRHGQLSQVAIPPDVNDPAASEFKPLPIAPQLVLQGPLAALLEWQALAEGAYSANMLRAQKADGAIFQAYCEAQGETYLPADPKTVRGFIAD